MLKKILPCMFLPIIGFMPIITSCGQKDKKTLSFDPDITKQERDCGSNTMSQPQESEIWFWYETLPIVGTTNFSIGNVTTQDIMINDVTFDIGDKTYTLELAAYASEPKKIDDKSFSFKIAPMLIHNGTDYPTTSITTSWTGTYTLIIKIDGKEFTYTKCRIKGQFEYAP